MISVAGGSINMPVGATINSANVFENIITGVGQTLRGVGIINTINLATPTSLCGAACELTYRFDNYLVTSFSSTGFTASGGTINVFLGFGSDVDFNPFTSGSSAADLIAATNGTSFLNLAGHSIDGTSTTLSGNGSLVVPFINFAGSGLLDVVAGPGAANSHFDTNGFASITGPADVFFTSSGAYSALQPGPHSAECPVGAPTGAECVSGSATFFANVVPEPGTLALLGAAFGGLGFGLRRRRETQA
jgi:hypothetical protein